MGWQRTGDESGRAVGKATCSGGMCVQFIESLAVAGVTEGVDGGRRLRSMVWW